MKLGDAHRYNNVAKSSVGPKRRSMRDMLTKMNARVSVASSASLFSHAEDIVALVKEGVRACFGITNGSWVCFPMLPHPKYLRRFAFWICASHVNQPFEIVMFEETIILYAKTHVNI